MVIIASFPVLISYWLISAHFLRDGNFFMVLTCFFAPGLLLFEEKWAARVLQVGLFLASFEWIHTLIDLARWRMMAGQPYERLVAILGTVALFTFLSAFAFRFSAMKKRFQLDPPTSSGRL